MGERMPPLGDDTSPPPANDVWAQLGRDARVRRESLHMNQAELAQVAGVDVKTIIRLEKGVPATRRAPSWPRIEEALGWPPGHIVATVERDARRIGYLIEVPDAEAAGIAGRAVREAVIATLPDATIAQMRQVEELAVAALRDAGLLPPDSDAE